MKTRHGQVVMDGNNWPEEGYYKRRAYSGGPKSSYVPIRMRLVEGPIDDAGDKIGDDVIKAYELTDGAWVEIDPFHNFTFMKKIEKDEYEWLTNNKS